MVRILVALSILVGLAAPAAASNVALSIGVSSGDRYRHHGRPPHYKSWSHPRFHGHYRPRTVFLYRAPIYVAPPSRVIYYESYPTYPPPPPTVTPTAQCRTFNGDATIDGSGTPFYGRACLYSDGRWHIVP